MCSACGVLQDRSEWFEGVGASRPLLAERQRRLKLVNKMLAPSGAVVSEFGGTLTVRNQMGMTRVVPDLAHLWKVAAEIGRCSVDPLACFPDGLK